MKIKYTAQSGIYVITNVLNSKLYVGQAICFEARWKNHKNSLKRGNHSNRHLQHSWNKHGEHSFVFEIIESCPVELLGFREVYWITVFDSLNPSKGYNIEMSKEDGGKIVSSETRKKISLKRKLRGGLPHSPESRRRISEGNKGKRRTKEQNSALAKRKAKSFRLINPSGQIVEGLNLRAFARKMALNQGNLQRVVAGKSKSYKKWTRPN